MNSDVDSKHHQADLASGVFCMWCTFFCSFEDDDDDDLIHKHGKTRQVNNVF